MKAKKIVWLALLGGLTTACASTPDTAASDRDLEFAHEVITSFAEEAGGGAYVGLGIHAPNYRIDPELSPKAAQLLAFARQAHAAKTPVHATIWIREKNLSKADAMREVSPGEPRRYPWVIVRLANDPDPRRPGGAVR